MSSTAQAAQDELAREKAIAEQKAHDVAAYAKATGESVKEEGKSWWNWGGSKAEDGKEGLRNAALAAEKKVEEGAQVAQEKTKRV